MSSDKNLKQAVLDELPWEPSVDAALGVRRMTAMSIFRS